MRSTEKRLYDFLQECSRSARTFTVSEAAEASGYTPSTVRTYLCKKLTKAGLVREAPGGFVSSMPASFTESAYKHLMTQVAEDPLAELLTPAEWAAHLSRVLRHAESKHLRISAADAQALIARLRMMGGLT